MSTTVKHSPGPWTLEQHAKWPFDLIIRDANGNAIGSQGLAAYSTADRTAEVANAREDNAETLANEALRAAAPQLLAALLYARRFLNSTDHDTAFVDAAIAAVEVKPTIV